MLTSDGSDPGQVVPWHTAETNSLVVDENSTGRRGTWVCCTQRRPDRDIMRSEGISVARETLYQRSDLQRELSVQLGQVEN